LRSLIGVCVHQDFQRENRRFHDAVEISFVSVRRTAFAKGSGARSLRPVRSRSCCRAAFGSEFRQAGHPSEPPSACMAAYLLGE
jgi:hypothetical protein